MYDIFISYRRDGSFIGGKKICEEIKDRKKAKPVRRVGLVMTAKAPPPRSHCKVLAKDGKKVIGEVSSGSHSPVLNKGIAMAYLPVSYAKVKQAKEVLVQIRNRAYPAKVTAMPFVPNHFYRG